MANIQEQMKKVSAFFQGKNFIIAALLVISVVLGGYLVWLERGSQGEGPAGGGGGSAVRGALSKEKAGEVALAFINETILKGAEKAVLQKVEDESGVYRLTIKISDQEYSPYCTYDGKMIFLEGIKISSLTIGDFNISENEVCLENGKPLVYFFGSNTCPHCQWEHPVVEKVAKSFGDAIAFHNNMDSDQDRDVLSRYNPSGGIPTLVLGCKYFRVGSGENSGEEQEAKNLTALICKLSGGGPEGVCKPVQDLIDKIK